MDDNNQTVTITIKIAGMNQAGNDLKSTKNTIDNFGNDLAKGLGIKGIAIGTALGNGISNAVGFAMDTVRNLITSGVDIVKESIGQAAQFQTTALGFKTFIGDAEKSKQVLIDISNLSMKTPIPITDLQKEGEQLLAMGVNTKDLVPLMKELSTVSLGNASNFDSLASSMSQMKEQEVIKNIRQLNVFLQAGVPIYDLLADKINKVGFASQAGNINIQKYKDQVDQLNRKLEEEKVKLGEAESKHK